MSRAALSPRVAAVFRRRPPRLTAASRVALITALLCCVFAVPSPDAQTRPYVLRPLGALPGETFSLPIGINARGDVVGYSGSSLTRAFLYRDGVGMVELPGLPGHTVTYAAGINDHGVIVGGGRGPGLPEHALRWTGGLAEDLGVLGDALDNTSGAWDINNAGITVGSSANRAVMHSDAGGWVNISLGWNATAYDVNDLGQVTGSASIGAFRWSPGTGFEPLGVLDGLTFSYGKAVNVSGQVAGQCVSSPSTRSRFFRYTDGLGMVEMGGAGETNVVWGMNSRGDFVGEGCPGTGPVRAVLHTDEGGLRALNELIDASPQWFLLAAYDINDAGQILAYGYDNATGLMRSCRLDPVTPAGPLASLALTPVRVVGAVSLTGWVSLTALAPAGGASVALASDDPARVAVPTGVLVPAGQRHASFPVVTTNPPAVSNVRFTASWSGQTRSATLAIEPAVVTGIGPGPSPSTALRLMPCFPNPAGVRSRIRFELAGTADVAVRILDVHGRRVRAFRLAGRPGGAGDLVWDLRSSSGARVGAGVYHVELEAGGQRAVTRLVVLPG